MTKLHRRHVHQHPDLTGRPPASVVFCNGAGVDSMALIHLWCTNPNSRDFGLDELVPGTIRPKEHQGFHAEWCTAREREAVRGGGATPLPLAM